MINNKVILICMMTLFMLLASPLALASDDQIASIGEIKQYTAISLPQGGSNGTDSWDHCNITSIIDPEKNIILGMVEMTKIDMVFNYTLDAYNTSKLGVYMVNTMCYDRNNMIPGSYTFEVTTTGSSGTSSLWITLILIIFAFVVLIMAAQFDNIFIGFLSGILFLVSGIFVIIYGLGSMTDLYTQTIAAVLWAISMMVIYTSAFNHDDSSLFSAFGFKEKERDEYDHFTRDDGY